MRIVGGSLRGRPLAAPEGAAVRPTSDRAREALFNILEHGRWAADGSPVAGARVLDAFAGTGALGLEALSRGAAHVTFLEQASSAFAVLKDNVTRLNAGDRAVLLRGDATAPTRAPAACSLVFLDPPYGKDLGPSALAALAAAGWIAEDAVVVLEVGAREALAAPDGFTIEDERRYGAARLVLMRYGSATRT
ncbi:DNA methyltransferase [Aliidongia dinghuensis]|uniref:DNA methyltransferase n=1 Tax=Aliidongia dinghuensis TaxID=1867774 RepID=A0A8J2YTI9_9PROT|nr:16S rRNA (guanine(966)-N(2))-methyltransferase RsmD [Aliidongia dinghuensis]GGF16013.1 DNA methyltransferase [Aliidongia dinghuensis]